MTNPFKQQQVIDNLKKENAALREELTTLRNAGNDAKIHLFKAQTQRAVVFALKAVDERTMELVRTKLAPAVGLHPKHPMFGMFQDCLRMASHLVNPATATNLYQVLSEQPIGPGVKVPSLEEVEAILAGRNATQPLSPALSMDAKTVPRYLRPLFFNLRTLGQMVEAGNKDTIHIIQQLVAIAQGIDPNQHPSIRFTLELAEAVDNAAADIGGSRPQRDILRDALNSFVPPEPSQ